MESKTTIIIFIFFSFLSPYLITVSSTNITAVFGFGDAIIDTGNNNFLPTNYRSDHKPYGRDFSNQTPTGRFSSGKLLIDLLTSRLVQKDLLPPYLNPELATDDELLTGASFGSAGAGVDPLTAREDNVLDFTAQVDLFDEAVVRIRRSVGKEKAKFIVENGLFYINTGDIDFVNFYSNSSGRSSEFNISGYGDFMLKILKAGIQRLYNKGGRRFIVASLPPIGCLPLQITVYGNSSVPRRCVQQQNSDAVVFNEKLRLLALRLESQVLPASKVAYFAQYNSFMDIINNPANYGIEETSKGCCGTGLSEYGETCKEPIQICPNPSKYLFWDALHPSPQVFSGAADAIISTIIPFLYK